MTTTTDTITANLAHGVTVAWMATVRTARRIGRAAHAIFTVTRRHVPAWMAGVLTVCLFIPGPVDEFLVLIVIAGMVWFKPAMRSELVTATRKAWKN